MWLRDGEMHKMYSERESLILCHRLINACKEDDKEPTYKELLGKAREFISQGWYGVHPERAAARARQTYRNHYAI